jgi:hypothetical protein
MTGLRPFKSATALETVVKHLEKDPEPLQSVRPEIPASVAAVVSRLMAKDPARRFQTPAEMVAELDFLCGKGEGAAKATRPPARLLPVVMTSPKSQGTSNKFRPAAATSAADTAPDGSTANPTPRPPALGHAADGPPQLDPNSAASAAPEMEPIGTLVAVQTAWNQWVTIVEAYAGAQGQVQCDEGAYRHLHRSLLEMCQSRPDPAGAAPSVYRRLEAVLEPWVTPAALKGADEAALASLVEQCRQLNHELGNKRGGAGFWMWLLILAAAVIAAVSGWQWYRQWAGPAAKLSLAGVWQTIQVKPVLTAAVVVPLAVMVSIASVYAWCRRAG